MAHKSTPKITKVKVKKNGRLVTRYRIENAEGVFFLTPSEYRKFRKQKT